MCIVLVRSVVVRTLPTATYACITMRVHTESGAYDQRTLIYVTSGVRKRVYVCLADMSVRLTDMSDRRTSL